MQATLRNYKKIVIRDIQKQVEVKMIQKFLVLHKSFDQIKSFNKVGNEIHLDFHNQKDAQAFISVHNHLSKIMLKKFNISYAFFTSQPQQKFPRYQVFGLNEQNRRNVYQVCCKYSPCFFELKYENNKLDPKSLIYFEKLDNDQLQSLKNFLLTLNIKLRQEDNYGDFDKFRVSIQLCNFAQIQTSNLQPKQQLQVSKKVEALIKQITNEQPIGIEIHTYFQSQYKMKAYFRFKSIDLTFDVFEKLRLHLLQMPQQMQSKLFYFQKDSNSFYTLFTSGLINSQQQSLKKYEDALLKAFRNINPNITQIILNFKGSTYTGKIYFKSQADGKDFLANYGRNRQHYYMFYKQGFNVVIDMFQTQKQIKKQYQYQQNAQQIFSHLQQTRKETEIVPIQPLQYGHPNMKYNNTKYHNKYDNYPRQNYNRQNNKYREKETEQVQSKYRERKADQPKQQKKVEKKQDLKLKQDEFPTL